jgi:urease accessory protein
MNDNLQALVRLLQLASPALPVGAYSYSQGLEWAIDARVVHDAASAEAWIGDILDGVLASGEAPVLKRLIDALAGNDAEAFCEWNAWYRASRETRELRAETEQMAGALVALGRELGWVDTGADALASRSAPVTLPAAWALVSLHLGIGRDALIAAYLYAWIENQALAAMKAIPLGQVAGQRLVARLGTRVPAAVGLATTIADDDVTSFAPGLALASTLHETQYSRLFRS